jgi:hypothetical protein
MRWFVDVSSVGKAAEKQRYCVDADSWQRALQSARTLRNDPGPMTGFSIELLDDGFSAVDPIKRQRYAIRKAPADEALTTAGAPAASATPSAKPPAPSVPPIAPESRPGSRSSRPPAPDLNLLPKGTSKGATPSPSRAAAAPAAPGLEVLAKREEDPSASKPLTYREYAYLAEGSQDRASLEALLRGQLARVQSSIQKVKAGKLVNLALFDARFTGRPSAPPIATLTWKDWRGNAVVTFPDASAGYAPPPSARLSVEPPPVAQPVSTPPEPVAVAAVQPAPVPVTAPVAEPAPVPVAAPVAEPAPVPVAAPVAEPAPVPVTAPVTEPAPVPVTAPVADPAPVPVTAPVADPAPVPVAAPVPEPVAAIAALPSTQPSAAAPGSFPPPKDAADAPPDSFAPPTTRGSGLPSQPPISTRTPNAKGRLRGDELIADLFESMHDLQFLRDAIEGADFCLTLALEKMPSRGGIVHLYDIDRREYVITCAGGIGGETLLLKRSAENDPILSQAMRKRRSLVFSDAKASGDVQLTARYTALGGAESLVVAPVALGGRFLGAIELLNPIDNVPFTDDDGHALSYIAEQLASFVGSRGIILDRDQPAAAGTR